MLSSLQYISFLMTQNILYKAHAQDPLVSIQILIIFPNKRDKSQTLYLGYQLYHCDS